MNLETMYPGVPYSPSTFLTQPVNATDTTIYVDDISVFPASPNIAVIGVDESAETIIYGSKSGNMLVGVQRGVEGTAKSWEINDEIGRNWTNKDYQSIQAANQLGVTIPITGFFGTIVICWLISNEGLSIVENLGEIGVPAPKFITQILEGLREFFEKFTQKKD